MAAVVKMKSYSPALGGIPITISSIMGRQYFVTDLSIRASRNNIDDYGIYNEIAAVNQGSFIGAGEGWGISLSQARFSTDSIVVAAGAGLDTIYVTIIT